MVQETGTSNLGDPGVSGRQVPPGAGFGGHQEETPASKFSTELVVVVEGPKVVLGLPPSPGGRDPHEEK